MSYSPATAVTDSGEQPGAVRNYAASVDLYWLPLGAGESLGIVRWSGRAYEALAARRQKREVCDLYHSALRVRLGDDEFAIEMAPVWGNKETDRGVVCAGAVGARWLGHSRFFRYEVRRWRGGAMPDQAYAVGDPLPIDTDERRTQRLLDVVPDFPAVTWGRDELRTGEMWNSNSLTAWLLASSGHDTGHIMMPARGRAPGWTAGLTAAARPAQGPPPR
jgi:hypothetical protein